MYRSYMGRQATCTATVSCLWGIYFLIGYRATVSSASSTEGHFYSLTIVRCAIIPVTLLANQWWNPSRTLSTSPITTQLPPPYHSTYYTTTLYIIPPARTVAPVFKTEFLTIATVFAPPRDSGTGPPNSYYCMRPCIPGTKIPRPDPEALSSHLLKPGRPWRSVVGLSFCYGVPPWAGIFLTHNAGSWGAKVVPESHISRIC